MKLSITCDGEIMAIYSDDLVGLIDLGRATITRASDVEPLPGGGWCASMRQSLPADKAGRYKVVMGPFRTRAEALAAEVEYLERRLFGSPVDSGNSGV